MPKRYDSAYFAQKKREQRQRDKRAGVVRADSAPARTAARARTRRAKLAKIPRPFVAIDGEGRTLKDGSHIYVLLAASDGSYVWNEDGLSFEECADYFLRLLANNFRAIFVSYGFSYDGNMIMQSLGLPLVKRYVLEREDAFEIVKLAIGKRRLLFRWVPRKELWIKEDGAKKGIQIFDVLGFFQSSFLKALVKNKIGTKKERELIDRMKKKRSSFHTESKASILKYCRLELSLLVRLMDNLRDATDSLEWKLTRWDGAGAMAAALLREKEVKQFYLADPTTLDPLMIAGTMCGYFGGRFETFQLGEVGDVWQYDIRSAYPYAMTELPDLSDAEIVFVDSSTYDPSAFGLYFVEWNIPPDSIVGPFPFRIKGGRILYPSSGRGWYWQDEVRTAIKYYGSAVRVNAGYEIMTGDNRPFGWTRDIFALRAHYKDIDDGRELPLKLALNSCYGKMAQGVGSATYQNYIFAGMITSNCRARIFDLIMRNDAASECVFVATDGVAFTRKLEHADIGKKLGQWEEETFSDMFSVANGQRQGWKGDTPKAKTRGYGTDENIDWPLLRKRYREKGLGAYVNVPFTRFIGAALAAHRNKPELWCRWVEDSKKLRALPGFSRFVEADDWVQPSPIVKTKCWPVPEGEYISRPYTPTVNKLSGLDEEQRSRFLEKVSEYFD